MLHELTLEQLDRFEANCRKAPQRFRGKYNLDDVRAAQRNKFSNLSDLYREIVKQLSRSSTHLLTYKQVWHLSYPDQQWVWRRSLRTVKQILDDLIRYCVLHDLPIITVRVVQRHKQMPAANAIRNIHSRCKQLHYDVPTDPELFVSQQLLQTEKLLSH